MIRCCILVMLMACALAEGKLWAQTISPVFFGQNAWMPDSIGQVKYYGQLHDKWQEIGACGAQTIRFGGIAPDQNKPTNYQYIKMIDSIRAKGMEPIIQVPFNNGTYTTSQAAEIVYYINITRKKNIKYWIIGNEPDHVYKYTSSSQVAPYLKAFSSAMKNADPSIKTIGPETAWYNSGIINGLTSPGGPYDVTGKDNNGRYYIDYISFHTYPFNGTQSRSDVLNYLQTPDKFNDNLITLNARLASCNSFHNRTGDSEIKIAVTEANINYMNSGSDNLQGNGATSFIGGQFWAEMLSVAMKNKVEIFNFWSVIEGNSVALNIGFLNKFNGNKQPSYYHFKMLADNFRGVYYTGTDNQGDVKVFGSKNELQTTVVILNQNSTTDHVFNLRLNNENVTGSQTLKINIDAGISKEYSGTIQNQSTTLLIFDNLGNILKKCEYKMNGHANNNLPPSCTYYEQPVTITASGSTTICEGESVLLSTTHLPAYAYQWMRNNEVLNGETFSSYTATLPGDYTVTVTNINTNGTQVSSPVNVSVIPHSAANIFATGSASLCFGETVTLNANTDTGLTYQWIKDDNFINGAINFSFIVSQEGVYEVAITKNGCTNHSNAITVDITPKPAPIIQIDGHGNFCESSSILLSVNNISGETYQWKLDSINIFSATEHTYEAEDPGVYFVTATNKCGTITSEGAHLTACLQNDITPEEN